MSQVLKSFVVYWLKFCISLIDLPDMQVFFFITLASGFMQHSLSVSCRNCGKLVASGIVSFFVCFF